MKLSLRRQNHLKQEVNAFFKVSICQLNIENRRGAVHKKRPSLGGEEVSKLLLRIPLNALISMVIPFNR